MQDLKEIEIMRSKLLVIGILTTAVILSAAHTVAQPAPKSGKDKTIREIDQTPVGQPQEVKTANGFKLIYKNKDGQVCKEEQLNDLHVKVESKTITAIYPSGASAKEQVETFGEKNGKLGEKLTKEERELDSHGNPTRSVTYKYDDNGEAERKIVKENGETREYVPDPGTLTDYGTAWKEVFQDTNIKPPEIPAPKKEEPRPPHPVIDPCLVGEWETAAVSGAATGGNGFHLTIKRDGTQIVDYSAMQILTLQDLTYRYGGVAEGVLSTENGTARNVSVKRAGVTLAMGNMDGEQPARPTAGMGPGALGVNRNTNSYACSANSLKYATEDFRGKVFLQITMKRSKREVTP